MNIDDLRIPADALAAAERVWSTPRCAWNVDACVPPCVHPPYNADSEFLETKLRGYDLVTDLTLLCPSDHVRITQNKYQEDGRKCSYIILKRYDADDEVWWVNSYKPVYADWEIDIGRPNRHKQVRFYRKREVPRTDMRVRLA